MKILVVDDSQFIRIKIKNILLDCNHTVLEAGDGSEAIKIFDRERPEIVFLDLVMPGMSGKDVLKNLKAINPKVKVIICSSVGAQEEFIKDVVAAGASDIITKPFQKEDITQAITKI